MALGERQQIAPYTRHVGGAGRSAGITFVASICNLLAYLCRPVGLMDRASASGAGDSRFESWAGQHQLPFLFCRASPTDKANLAETRDGTADVWIVGQTLSQLSCGCRIVGVGFWNYQRKFPGQDGSLRLHVVIFLWLARVAPVA